MVTPLSLKSLMLVEICFVFKIEMSKYDTMHHGKRVPIRISKKELLSLDT